jgi:S1-C subfamily serine protease
MMEYLRWHSVVAAVILGFCAPPLKAQNPLEQLEAKLLEREKNQATKPSGTSKPSDPSSETLPGLKNKSAKSLLVNPASPVPPPNLLSEKSPPASARANVDQANTEPPYLGMTLERPVGGGLGLRVVEVVNQSPAWKSGFRIDDRILAIAGNAVSDIDSFAAMMAQSSPNELVKFLVERRGRQMEINVVLIPRSIAAKTIPNATIPSDPLAGNSPLTPTPPSPTQPRIPLTQDNQGAWGLMLAPLSDAFRRQFGIPVFRGASILEVAPNSPGFLAGLAPGDCIVDIDGASIRSDEDVVQWKRSAPERASYPVSFYRGGQLMQSAIPGSNASSITTDMLTPEYVRRLQAEINELRLELNRSKERIQSLENATDRTR